MKIAIITSKDFVSGMHRHLTRPRRNAWWKQHKYKEDKPIRRQPDETKETEEN
jgi:hypothetical protein